MTTAEVKSKYGMTLLHKATKSCTQRTHIYMQSTMTTAEVKNKYGMTLLDKATKSRTQRTHIIVRYW